MYVIIDHGMMIDAQDEFRGMAPDYRHKPLEEKR
jgi:hypothetical protein